MPPKYKNLSMKLRLRNNVGFWVSVCSTGCLLQLLLLAGNARVPDSTGEVSNMRTQHLSMINRSQRDLQNLYPYLKLDANQLHIKGDSSGLIRVFQKLDSIYFNNTGKLTITHMGGSHVQAGMIGQRIRAHFNALSLNMVSSRGMLFPFREAGTNNTVQTSSRSIGDWKGCRCAHNKHHCRWGVSGTTVITTTDSSELHFWANAADSVLHKANEVRLYFDQSQPHFTPEWIGNAEPSNVSYNRAGGYMTWFFNEAADTLKFRFVKADSLAQGISVHGFWMGNTSPGITFNDLGANGASTRSYLRCQDFAKQWATLNTDLVLFAVGVNDANVPAREFDPAVYKARYDSLIAPMRRANPDLAILFITNNDVEYRGRTNVNGAKVRTAMYELAEKHNAVVFDLYEVMGGPGSIDDWYRDQLAKKDRIHFTRDGYYLFADLLYSAFMTAYGDWIAANHSLSDHMQTLPRRK